MINTFTLALSTLLGTIVGAGIFGLPYVIWKSGIAPGIFYLILLGGVAMLLHLFVGEIALRTSEKHRLIGYADLYLGNWAKIFVTISTIVGTTGALLAYIIIGGGFLKILFSSFLPAQEEFFSLIFWAVLSLSILKGIQMIAKMEFFMSIVLFAVVFFIFLVAFPHVEASNFTVFDLKHIFLPYGVILFAFAGWSAIPEIADFFKKGREKRNLDNLIVWTSLIVGVLYLLFAVFVVGVSGSNTSEDALSGLIPYVGNRIVFLGALFGFLAVGTSFLVLGNYLKNSLRYDYKLPLPLSAGIAIFAPILLYFLGFKEFITVVGLLGALIGVMEGVIIVLMYQSAKNKGDRIPEYSLRIPRFVFFGLIALLVGGAIAEFITKFPFSQ